jgi:hypothetical protein
MAVVHEAVADHAALLGPRTHGSASRHQKSEDQETRGQPLHAPKLPLGQGESQQARPSANTTPSASVDRRYCIRSRELATDGSGHSSARATDAAPVRATEIAAVQAGRRSELGLFHELWRGTLLRGESVIWSRGVVARRVGLRTLALGIAVGVVAPSMTGPAAAAVCHQLFEGSAHAVFNHLLHAHLRLPRFGPPTSHRVAGTLIGLSTVFGELRSIRVHPRTRWQVEVPRTA